MLVTGAAGFIGSHLCDRLLEQDYEVVGIDNLSVGRMENLKQCLRHPRFDFHLMDVVDSNLIQIEETLDVVVHLAARKIPRYGGAIDTLSTNALGAFNVLGLALSSGAKAVMISTSDVYGKNPAPPFSEKTNSVFGPSNVPRWGYGVSKLFVEHLAFAYWDAYDLPIVIARLFGVYGPRQTLDWRGGPQSVFISAILENREVEIHGNGRQTRTFCYVEDVIDGLMEIIKNDKANGEVFNIAGGEGISIIELARFIKKLIGSGPLKVRYVPYSEFGNYEDVPRRTPWVAKAKQILGFEAKMSLEEGLLKTIEWQRREMGL